MDIQDRGIQHVIYICGYRSIATINFRMRKGDQSSSQ
jgi:uncharacterized protein YcbK (DUF882 family)